MLVFFEGIVMCFILVMYCVVGIRNGAVGLVCLYEKDVQERVVELGLVTKEQINKQFIISSIVTSRFSEENIEVKNLLKGLEQLLGFRICCDN